MSKASIRLALVAAVILAVVPGTAQAAFPGQNGKIAFVSGGAIWTMNPDGSNRTQFNASGFSPAWSPDGSRIAYAKGDGVHVVNADGSGDTLIAPAGREPAWAPSGTRLAYVAGSPEDCDIRTINADGTGGSPPDSCSDIIFCCFGGPAWAPDESRILFHYSEFEVDPNTCEIGDPCDQVPGPPQIHLGYSRRGADPNWSPDAQEVAYPTTDWGSFYSGPIAVTSADGSATRQLTTGADTEPAWSPDGTKIAFARGSSVYVMNASDGNGLTSLGSGGQPDWQPLPVDAPPTYVKPKGATPLRVPLVPAYRACTAPNRTHGAPLAYPSCAPPRREPMGLTIGVGDETPPPAKSIGSVVIKVHAGAPGPPDDADAQLLFSLTNVLNDGSNTDYTGQLATKLSVRLTDAHGGVGATTQDFPLVFQVPCTATADTTLGSTCQTATTAEAVMPGVITEGDRAIWALDRIRVYVPYGSALTNPDRLFAVQGIFIP